MTTEELHKILDDENKKISLEEYQEVLYQLKNDTIACATQEEFELQKQTPKYHWYYGETNAFQIALDLSEHINQNQKAIEYLTKIQIFISDNAVYAEDDIFGREINNFIDIKIKELKGEKE